MVERYIKTKMAHDFHQATKKGVERIRRLERQENKKFWTGLIVGIIVSALFFTLFTKSL